MTFREASDVLAAFDRKTVYLQFQSPQLHRQMREEFADAILGHVWATHWLWDHPQPGAFKWALGSRQR